MAILHIYMRYQHHPMKIVGRVRETMKKRQKTPLLTLIFDLWGKKIKIPPYYVFAYGHSTHFYVISAQSNENCWTSSREYEKKTKNDKFFPRYLTFGGKKIKIPPHYVFAYGHSTHFYVISAQSNENCWTSSRKYEKNTKNDKFFPRCDLDLNRVTLRPMPGYSCI